MKARAKLLSGGYRELDVCETRVGNVITASPRVLDYSDIEYIDLGYDLGCAKVGDDGYFVVPRGAGSADDHICEYIECDDAELVGSDFQMTMFGFVKNGAGFCAIVTGFTYDYKLVRSKKGEDYEIYVRFPIGGKFPYEKLEVEYHFIDSDADYSAVARIYRQYMLDVVGCRLIRDRLTPELDYAKDSLYVRIRMGWKPVPSPVLEQTEENEPEMHVAITFDEVGELMAKLKAAGVEKAEFCLVGWNIGGHDGRWPQHLPVDSRLGGEEGLRRLIARSNELGYQITCHTNTTDAYSIADSYSDYIARKTPDGEVACHGGNTTWGGGKPRWVCPAIGFETAKRELPKVAELGFRGLHYIDVISTIATVACYDPAHPQTKRQCAENYKNCAKLSKELFGGFSSEGGYDHTAPYLDYGLYVSFFNPANPKPALFTRCVPIWQIAFHGIILSNPFTATVNAPIKDRATQLRVIERGGRPTIYIYSKFKTNGSWMGDDDIICTTPENVDVTVKYLSEMYKEFAPMARLQTELIDRHEESDGVARTYYADGTVATVNFNDGTYTLSK